MRLITPLLTLILLSCKNNTAENTFLKDRSGLEYKILNEGSGDAPKQGEFIKMEVRQVYDDSVLSDTRNRLPQYQRFDSTEMSKESYNIFYLGMPSSSTIGANHQILLPTEASKLE